MSRRSLDLASRTKVATRSVYVHSTLPNAAGKPERYDSVVPWKGRLDTPHLVMKCAVRDPQTLTATQDGTFVSKCNGNTAYMLQAYLHTKAKWASSVHHGMREDWPRRVPRQLGRPIATPVAVPVGRAPQMCVRSTVLCCRANRRGLLMFCIPVANFGKTLLFRHEAVRLTFLNETRVTGSGCVPAHHRPSASLIRKGRSRRLWRDWAGGQDPWGGGLHTAAGDVG